MAPSSPLIATPILYTYTGGAAGPWRISSIEAVVGEGLPAAARLAVRGAESGGEAVGSWSLRGVTSNGRYTTGEEARTLAERQPSLGRAEATRAALIPIRKSPSWWALAQDARRELLQETSRHISIGLDYLPAIARRLHHGRDLGEPFDFLTWFEFAPTHEADFNSLLKRLRATPEWAYVDREVDVRVRREVGEQANALLA